MRTITKSGAAPRDNAPVVGRSSAIVELLRKLEGVLLTTSPAAPQHIEAKFTEIPFRYHA